MKVLHVSIYDKVGGACIAAYRQHQALLRHGVNSCMWVKGKVTADDNVYAYAPPINITNRVERFLRRKFLARQASAAGTPGSFFDDRSEYAGDELACMPSCDIVNVQFAQKFVDHPAFFRNLPPEIPIVVTLHEMSCFTGGCSYTGGCSRFQQSCGNCPQLSTGSEHDISRKGWERRRDAYAARPQGKLHFVADSHWIADQAKASGLLGRYPVSVIHYGVDTDVYRPLDRASARDMLGIPANTQVLAFAAVSVHNKRKGMRYIHEALDALPSKPFLLTWGGKTPPVLGSTDHLHLGNIDSEHLMAMAYNAADIFVMPSMEEAFGQTSLEALSCGIPVIAFDVGGIPDMVKPGQNGYLVPPGDSKALAGAIENLLADRDTWKAMSIRAREMVLAEFSMTKNASLYRSLYTKLLANDSSTFTARQETSPSQL